MNRVTINYQKPDAETLKRAEQWIRDYADPAQTFVEVLMSDDDFRKLQDAKASVQVNAKRLGE